MVDNTAFQRAFQEHDEAVSRTLPGGDPHAIKQLYVELATSLEAAIKDGEAPVLSYPETAPAVVPLLASTSGAVLDAGCGPNPVSSIALGRSGRMVVGVDIGLGMVTLARRAAERVGVDFLGVVADVERLPFADGVFGAVVCDDTIEHLPNDRAGVEEVVRVTADGGRAVLATPNRRRLNVLVRRVRDVLRGERHPSAHYFEVASHLREYGWRDFERLAPPHARVVARGHVPWSRADRLGRLANRLTRLPGLRQVGRVVLVCLQPTRAHDG